MVGRRAVRAKASRSLFPRAPACGGNQLSGVRDVAWATTQWSDERRQKLPLRDVCNSCVGELTRVHKNTFVSVCVRCAHTPYTKTLERALFSPLHPPNP